MEQNAKGPPQTPLARYGPSLWKPRVPAVPLQAKKWEAPKHDLSPSSMHQPWPIQPWPIVAGQQFHPFPRLPQELRDLIWGFALNTHRPKIQFFSLSRSKSPFLGFYYPYSGISDIYGCSTMEGWDGGNGSAYRYSTRYRYNDSELWYDTRLHVSWVEWNRSAYMYDSALWDVCVESREYVKNRFEPVGWPDYTDADGQRGAWALGKIALPGRRSRHIMWQPGLDLVCFEHSRSAAVPSNRDTLLPLLRRSLQVLPGVPHLGILFDDSWEGWSGSTFLEAVEQCSKWPQVWLIDYGMRRRRGVAHPDSRVVFHGNRCRYVEVRSGDPDLNGWGGSFRFLDRMKQTAHELARRTTGLALGWLTDYFSRGQDTIGVLAYEELDVDSGTFDNLERMRGPSRP